MQADTATPEVVTSPICVFGRDRQGRPHASRFDAVDAPLAEKAAGLMGMQVLRLVSEEMVSLAATLPLGRVFASSGRGFVPYCKAETFQRLAATPGAFTPPAPPAPPLSALDELRRRHSASPAGDPAGEPENPADRLGTPPAGWGEVGVGSLVLAAEEGKLAVWYIATVVADRGEDIFELRWVEDGDGELPLIVRRREHLGLFPPALAGGLAEEFA